MNALSLRQPEATSLARLPQHFTNEFSLLHRGEADEATCFNPYVWRCDGEFFLCSNIERVSKGCLICLNADESPDCVEQKVRQPRFQDRLKLPQVASAVCLS